MDDALAVLVGKRSGRLYGIEVEGVSDQKVIAALRDALKRLDAERSLTKIPDENFSVAKQVLTENESALLGS